MEAVGDELLPERDRKRASRSPGITSPCNPVLQRSEQLTLYLQDPDLPPLTGLRLASFKALA